MYNLEQLEKYTFFKEKLKDTELDWMLDDYVRRYAPKPHASLTVGPTRSGMGLALNF